MPTLFFYGFYLFNNCVNVCGNVLYLCFYSNNSLKVYASNTALSKIDKFHPPLYVTFLNISSIDTPVGGSWQYNFRNADLNQINDSISSISFNSDLSITKWLIRYTLNNT